MEVREEEREGELSINERERKGERRKGRKGVSVVEVVVKMEKTGEREMLIMKMRLELLLGGLWRERGILFLLSFSPLC